MLDASVANRAPPMLEDEKCATKVGRWPPLAERLVGLQPPQRPGGYRIGAAFSSRQRSNATRGTPAPSKSPSSRKSRAVTARGESLIQASHASSKSRVKNHTRLRNWIVHPRKQGRSQLRPLSRHARFQTRQLALWYVELILLRLCGYSGPYTNRLGRQSVRLGSEEEMPWSAA